jgi:hypothetical protein
MRSGKVERIKKNWARTIKEIRFKPSVTVHQQGSSLLEQYVNKRHTLHIFNVHQSFGLLQGMGAIVVRVSLKSTRDVLGNELDSENRDSIEWLYIAVTVINPKTPWLLLITYSSENTS